MKEGEEEKTKSYSALIWTNKAIQKKDIEFLNDIKVVKFSLFILFLNFHKRVLSLLLYYKQVIQHGLWGIRPAFKSWLCHLLVEWLRNSSSLRGSTASDEEPASRHRSLGRKSWIPIS